LISALLALAIMAGAATPQPDAPPLTPNGIPTIGTATWYGSTHPQGKKFCYGGYKNSCNPYSKGEKVMYAAVATFRFGDTPYWVRVCRVGTTKCVTVLVRDYCHGAFKALKALKAGKWSATNRRAIDLSPAAFIQLAPMHLGVVKVIITEIKTTLGR
jgi:hypothetical protein